MYKHFLAILLVGLFTLTACGNEEKITYIKPLPDDGSACKTTEFKKQCRTDTSYSLCENDQVVTRQCDANQVCLAGECMDIAIGGQIQANCDDVGCNCDARKFRNSCDNGKRIACDTDVITEFDCSEYGLTCYNGECIDIVSASCDESFKSICIGNSLVSCDGGEIDVEYCDFDTSCLTIDDKADCYDVCDVDGKVAYRCGFGSDGNATKYTCTSTNRGLFYVASETTCYACFSPTEEGGFEEWKFDLADICLSKECTPGKAQCVDNHVVSCMNWGSAKSYKLDYDCGDKSCVVYNDEIAICADECKAELVGQHQRRCHNDAPDSIGFVCTQMGDKYYWIYDVNSKISCSHGCDIDSGECRKLHPDEGKACSDDDKSENYYIPRCDDNIQLFCHGNSVIAKSCGRETCLLGYDWFPSCFELCTEEEIKNPSYKCQYGIYSIVDDCVELESGKFIHRHEQIECPHGCDENTEQCIKLHKDEGNYCDDQELYCDGSFIMRCHNNHIEAEPCNYGVEDGKYTCVQITFEKNGFVESIGCEQTCSEEDALNSTLVCTDSEYDSSRLQGRVCVKSYDMGDYTASSYNYFWYDVDQICENGCNEAHDACHI